MQKFLRILSTFIIVVGGSAANLPMSGVAAAGCDDVQFIFARGSGENLGDVSFLNWQTAIRERLSESSLQYSFYELGSQPQGGSQYPAVAVAGSLGAIGNLLGAFVSAGRSFEFGKSVLAGRNELKAYLRAAAGACPNTRFVLGGYSQGAMVVSGSLDEIDSTKVIYVATFGDPKLYLPEGAGKRPDACRGKNLSNYRTYVTDCHAYEGVLGSYRPYQPAAYLGKLGTWCNGQDMMCSSGLSLDDHTAYAKLGLYRNAAGIILSKIRQALPQHFYTPDVGATAPDIVPHDLVIFFHAAGGMIGLTLAQYKLAAQRLASQVYSLGGRVALYIYGDNQRWQAAKLCDFSCTPDEFYRKLAQVTHMSGTDHYNSALSTMRRGLSELNWQIGATKSAVILTDRAYDGVDYNGCSVDDVAQLSLSIDPVNTYIITQRTVLEDVQSLPQATNGKAYPIDAAALAITEISSRPMASLNLESYDGLVGETFTFDARNNLNSSPIVRYDWDLDADGIFELQDSSATVQKIYSQPKTGYIQVRITDQNGYSSTMSARLNVTDTEPTPASISNLRVSKISETSYRLDFTSDADKILVTLGDLPIGQVRPIFQRSLTIDDVTARTTVRLVPYNSRTGRGEAATAEIGPAPQPTPITPNPAPNLNPAPGAGNQAGDSPSVSGSSSVIVRPPVSAPTSTPVSGTATPSHPITPSGSASNPAQGSALNSAHSSTQNPPQKPTTTTTIFIPKAPNTGIYRR